MALLGVILGSFLIWLLAAVLLALSVLKLPFTRMQVEGVPFSHELQFDRVARHIFDSVDVHAVREVFYVSGLKNISVFDLPYHFKDHLSPVIHNLISPSSRKVPHHPRGFRFLRLQQSGNGQVSVLALFWLKPINCHFRSCFHSNVKSISRPYVHKFDHYFIGFRRINSVEVQRSDLETRPLFFLHHLDLIVSRFCAIFSSHSTYGGGFCGDKQIISLFFENVESLRSGLPCLLSLSMYFLPSFAQDLFLTYSYNHCSKESECLQQANNDQPSCKGLEFPLYIEILASLLANFIAWWGGWLLYGKRRRRILGSALVVLGFCLYASVLTTILFCDPLFWRAEWRAFSSGQNPYRCQWSEYSEYRQTYQHDSGNVSQ